MHYRTKIKTMSAVVSAVLAKAAVEEALLGSTVVSKPIEPELDLDQRGEAAWGRGGGWGAGYWAWDGGGHIIQDTGLGGWRRNIN